MAQLAALPHNAEADGTGRPAVVEERPNRTGLPDHLKTGIERLSGISLDQVRVHFGSPQPAALNAHAFARGREIHEETTEEKAGQTEESSTAKSSAPPAHADLVLSNLQNSVAFVLALDKDPNKALPITQGFTSFIDGLMSSAPKPQTHDDKCSSPDTITAPLCAQLAFSTAQASNVFNTAESGAANDLHVGVGSWKLAVSAYQFAVQTAKATLDAGVEAAQATYTLALKSKPDAISRNLVLWYTLQASVLAASVAYESSLSSATAALSGAAGALLAEYATYVATINSAEATNMSSINAADETFWQGVETGRDG